MGTSPADQERMDTETPDMDYLLHLMDGFKVSMIVSVAADLKVFDQVDGMPDQRSTAKALAEKAGWNEDCTERLLDTLTSLKLLEKTCDGDTKAHYKVTKAGKYMVSEGEGSIWAVNGMVTRFTDGLLKQLPHEIQKGTHKKDEFPEHVTVHKTAEELQKQADSHGHGHGHGHAHFSQDPQAFLNRYQLFHGIALPHVPALVKAFDLSQYKSAVDLGGGTGVVSYQLARTYPDMCVTVFEVPKVVDLAREHFIPKTEQLNVSLLAGDFMKDDIPSADLYVLSKVIHDWSEAQAKEILRKVFAALNPGGAIMMFEKCLNDAKDGPMEAHLWDMLVMSHCAGRLRSAVEYGQLLRSLGYLDVKIRKTQAACSYDVILASKQ